MVGTSCRMRRAVLLPAQRMAIPNSQVTATPPGTFRRTITHICGVEMWRGGLGAAYLLPALSSAGASIASPCFRFHIPLIESDVRISRFRPSEKRSRCRPREIARPLAKADKAQHFVQRCRRKPVGRWPRHFVLGTQPLTQPLASVLIHRSIGLADWP
jgi:hypothetical protein